MYKPIVKYLWQYFEYFQKAKMPQPVVVLSRVVSVFFALMILPGSCILALNMSGDKDVQLRLIVTLIIYMSACAPSAIFGVSSIVGYFDGENQRNDRQNKQYNGSWFIQLVSSTIYLAIMLLCLIIFWDPVYWLFIGLGVLQIVICSFFLLLMARPEEDGEELVREE